MLLYVDLTCEYSKNLYKVVTNCSSCLSVNIYEKLCNYDIYFRFIRITNPCNSKKHRKLENTGRLFCLNVRLLRRAHSRPVLTGCLIKSTPYFKPKYFLSIQGISKPSIYNDLNVTRFQKLSLTITLFKLFVKTYLMQNYILLWLDIIA